MISIHLKYSNQLIDLLNKSRNLLTKLLNIYVIIYLINLNLKIN